MPHPTARLIITGRNSAIASTAFQSMANDMPAPDPAWDGPLSTDASACNRCGGWGKVWCFPSSDPGARGYYKTCPDCGGDGESHREAA